MRKLIWFGINDISVFFVKAFSFPKGIPDAHEKLHAMVPFTKDRKYFGISRPENGKIIYMAAAEETIPREAEAYHCPKLLLKKGRYLCIEISNYTSDITLIDQAFKRLLAEPGLDPEGYCVEGYINEKDVKCMIRLEK